MLHACPRKYELYKLGSDKQNNDLDGSGSVTLSFGHVVGNGLQSIFCGRTEEETIWEMFLAWDCDLNACDDKRHKSFWFAVIAIQRLIPIRNGGRLSEYQVVSYYGKPAAELGFIIDLPGGFKYRGFADLVLRHRISGEVLVLEAKTTWWRGTNPAKYKNSSQAIGYSVVLDAIFPGLSSYKVLYMEYQTTDLMWESWDFPKTYLQRAQWLQSIIFDAEEVQKYHDAGHFPMHGESCFSFNRECEYFQTCKMSNQFVTKPLTAEGLIKLTEDDSRYQIRISLEDLIQNQMEKSNA